MIGNEHVLGFGEVQGNEHGGQPGGDSEVVLE